MRIQANNIGYREIDRLSHFMHVIADRGVSPWGGDIAIAFSYDLNMDRSVCICSNGKKITSDDDEVFEY